ncbi:MAG: HNH endonuclease [Burkholderiaceae bacterium]
MPQRPNKPCRKQGCNALTRNANGYCDEHQGETVGWDHSKSASERGYGAKWRRLRDLILKRDSGLCQACKRAGRVSIARHVDHIINKESGGTDDPENLESLCVPCHKTKTQEEARRGSARKRNG